MINHAIFLEKLHAESNDLRQEQMMKDYMLNLSSADLHSFIFDNLRDIRTYVETADLSDAQRLSIAADLDKAKAMLQKKPVKQAA
jgi:hypothetical protein